MNLSSGARLVLVELKSPCLERDAASAQLVHGVVKNLAFTATFAMEGQYNHYEVDFHRFKLRATLLYDCDVEKEVHCVKTAPIIWETQVNETGERAVLTLRIMVLSSQHEDMCFRIKFVAVPPRNSPYLPLEAISAPLRVVSKQQQLRPVGTETSIKAGTTTKRKRPCVPIPSAKKQTPRSHKRAKKYAEEGTSENVATDFVSQIRSLLAAFNRIPEEERAMKIKAALQGDNSDLVLQLNSVADSVLKYSCDEVYCYSQQLPEEVMQAPFDGQTFCGSPVAVPNLDDLSMQQSEPNAQSVEVCPNPEGLFCSWDFEDKKDYEAEAAIDDAVAPLGQGMVTASAAVTPCSPMQTTPSYEQNPVVEDMRGDGLFFLGQANEKPFLPLRSVAPSPMAAPAPNLDLLDSADDFQRYCLHFMQGALCAGN